jgi:hypothetical protein
MGPCGGLSITIPPFFVLEALNVPWKMETEKTGTVNYTAENTILPRIWNKTP